MLENISADIKTIFPELFIILSAIALLIFGVYSKKESNCKFFYLAKLVCLGAIALVFVSYNDDVYSFNNLFHSSIFTKTLKIVILISTLGSLFLAKSFYKNKVDIFIKEYIPLILLSVVGMFFLVSANNLLSFYIALELQSLPLYILASIHRDDAKSSESGLKYFILGALSSGIILFGLSLIYGFTGATDFAQISQFVAIEQHRSLALTVGLVLLIIGLCFKVSAVPFHMWTPDVYQGSPSPVTAFFATAPKVAAVGVFVKFLYVPFLSLEFDWKQVVMFVAAASMIVGAIGAIKQSNFKRVIAYSSIGHMGFILAGLTVANAEGLSSIILYLIIYTLLSLSIFAVILVVQRNNNNGISIFSGISKTNPIFALAILVLMFSLAGVPPFAGFFSKFFILSALVAKNYYPLAVLGVVSSVIAAFYYLRIIKIVYFDESNDYKFTFDSSLKIVLIIGVLFNLLFIFGLNPILDIAKQASIWIK